ncbi:MAG: class I SAM-dependent methyltransferase, partial [Flaviflexus sp.]|uniref:class I SAM-dependent methyltransferase n=1 Tax=Flaviflexus sp. TaxID=1969482 RepID=UPI00352F394A
MPSPLHADVLQLLDQLPPYREDEVFALTNSLRKEGWQPDIISQALTQARLREKAVPKLGERASKMLFTSDALEQASRPEAAAHHAQVFLDAGVHSLREVGCGIGADTTAFAIAGLTVTARELDDDRALLARHNLADFDNVRIEGADGLADISEEGMWADPARRGTKGRISNPEEWMPALSQVVEAARGVRLAGIKVAPGIDYSHLPPDSRVEWLSIGRDLVEAIIWLGTDQPGRVATLLGKDQLTIDTAPDSAAEMVDAGELGTYLYEPDPAVIRAGGIAELCRRFDLAPVAPGIAYLTSDALVELPFLEAFTVQEVLPLQEKKLARELKNRGIGTLEIKKRGVDVAPEVLRKKLKLALHNWGCSLFWNPPLP